MHGFPTETEDEALLTLNYIKSIKWLDFPYLHNVRIFPGTEIEHFAIEAGIPKELIEESQDMSYHENAPTLPFSKEFTRKVKMIFTHDYVLNKERLLKRLPHQMKLFSEDELDQKYNAYFPSKINTLNDLLNVVGIKRSQLKIQDCLDEKKIEVPNLKTKIEKYFPPKKKDKDALKFLLIDLSTYYKKDQDNREYNVIGPPLGLMALLSYINKQDIADKVNGKMIKSFIDFNSNDELVKLIKDFNPDVIGVRAMTFYRNFFHDAIDHVRKNGISTAIIVGGPYPTAFYTEVLKDKNIDVVVIAEGEITITDILKRTLDNDKHFPDKEELKKVPGIAFLKESKSD